jgi:methionyl-tRNA formyltransferase
VCREDDHGIDEVFPSVGALAGSVGIHTVKPSTLDSVEFLEVVSNANVDIALSIQNNRVLPRSFLAHFEPKLGVANIHLSPLPRYAGYWPEMWAIWNGETQFGVTLHCVDDGIDTGDIIEQYGVAIDESDTRRSLYEKCVAAAHDMFCSCIDDLLKGTAGRTPQDASRRTYCPRALPNDGFVDPNWDGRTIRRFVRALAFRPYTGAKFRFGDSVVSCLEEDLQPFRCFDVLERPTW